MKISIDEYENLCEELSSAIFTSETLSEGAAKLFLLMEECFDKHTEDYFEIDD